MTSALLPDPLAPAWIDTHCHLDAAEFDADRAAVSQAAAQAGVQHMVIPAVEAANFATVARLAAQTPGAVYALGIHPMYTPNAARTDIELLEEAIQSALADARFVAIGEIGLDFFVPELSLPEARAQQEWFYIEQLKLARKYALPVLLHVRRSQDALLKQLRRIEVPGGIAHAFNGSAQQADAFVQQGFRLGFGGTLTFERSLQIRRLAATQPSEAIVLETDAPDIAPSWLARGRNAPGELPRIAQTLASLRGWDLDTAARITTANALAVLPRLARYCAQSHPHSSPLFRSSTPSSTATC